MSDLSTATAPDAGASTGAAPATSAEPAAAESTLLGQAAPTDNGAPLLAGDGPAPEADKGQKPKEEPKPEAKPAKKAPAAPTDEGLRPLPDDADDSQKEAFERKLRALNGVPDEPGGYGDFGYGEACDQTSEEYRHYTEAFHEAGLSPRQAKVLLDKHVEWSKGQVEHIQRQQGEEIARYRQTVRADFVKSLGGEENFKEFAKTAELGFKASSQGAGLSPEDSKALIGVLGDDPRFLKLFNHIGKFHRPDVLITGTSAKAAGEDFDDIFAREFNRK